MWPYLVFITFCISSTLSKSLSRCQSFTWRGSVYLLSWSVYYPFWMVACSFPLALITECGNTKSPQEPSALRMYPHTSSLNDLSHHSLFPHAWRPFVRTIDYSPWIGLCLHIWPFSFRAKCTAICTASSSAHCEDILSLVSLEIVSERNYNTVTVHCWVHSVQSYPQTRS